MKEPVLPQQKATCLPNRWQGTTFLPVLLWGLGFQSVLQTISAPRMSLGAESLLETGVGLASAGWGKNDLHRQTLTDSFSCKQVWAGALWGTCGLWIPPAACLGDDYQGNC